MSNFDTFPDHRADHDPPNTLYGPGSASCLPDLPRTEADGGHAAQASAPTGGEGSQPGSLPPGGTSGAALAPDRNLTAGPARPDHSSWLDDRTLEERTDDVAEHLDEWVDIWSATSPESLTIAAGQLLAIAGLPDLLARRAAADQAADFHRLEHERLAREIHRYRDAQKAAALAEFRIRTAAQLAIAELQSPGRPPAKAIADAAQTLANGLEGRALAAVRETAPMAFVTADDARVRATGAHGPLRPGVTL